MAMKHLGISGGGTKIGGLFGVAESIIFERGYQPDIISGISAGAVLSLPLALGKRNLIKEMVLDFSLKTFFNVPPVKENGKIRLFNAIGKIIAGKPYLGEQKNLERLLKQIVSREEFEHYKTADNLPICIVGAVDFYTGKRFYINLKEVSYDDFPKFVNASASLPIFTPGVKFNTKITDFEGVSNAHDKVLLFDGGVRDHSPSAKILNSKITNFNITETCTIFSRPESLYDILSPFDFLPRNLLKILERYVSITNAEVSKNDQAQEAQIIKEKEILDHGTFYLPRIMKGVYDVDKSRLAALYENSKEIVTDESWNDVTLFA
ncbi:patatin-like phospholipase family protein [Zhouia amylolytica]|nr:patatin-like phospholipase family protein [Zhouia amylolytica]